MSIVETLKALGIETPFFIAGVSGGIALLSKKTGLSAIQKFVIILSGGASANYLTPLVVDLLGLSDKTVYGIAFLIGYSGMKLVETLTKSIERRIKDGK